MRRVPSRNKGPPSASSATRRRRLRPLPPGFLVARGGYRLRIRKKSGTRIHNTSNWVLTNVECRRVSVCGQHPMLGLPPRAKVGTTRPPTPVVRFLLASRSCLDGVRQDPALAEGGANSMQLQASVLLMLVATLIVFSAESSAGFDLVRQAVEDTRKGLENHAAHHRSHDRRQQSTRLERLGDASAASNGRDGCADRQSGHRHR